jgi:hypothetical protein
VNVLCVRGYREERKNAEKADRNVQTGSHHFAAVVSGHWNPPVGFWFCVTALVALPRDLLMNPMRANPRARMAVDQITVVPRSRYRFPERGIRPPANANVIQICGAVNETGF